MKFIVLTGLPTKAKEILTHDLAAYYLQQGQRVTLLDNANVRDGVAALDVPIVNMRGGCACCSVAGKLYASIDDVTETADVAIMAADNQTHVGNLAEVLDNMVNGTKHPITLLIVAMVDERTQCCFPYVAETLEASAHLTLIAPFDPQQVIEAAR